MSITQKEIILGFVNLEKDKYPDLTKEYNVKLAMDSSISTVPYPDTEIKYLDLTLMNFYIHDLPDFGKDNEGLLKFNINTRTPDNIPDKHFISNVVEFRVQDKSYAPGISNRGIFRNVIFHNFINIGLNLVEVDPDIEKGYKIIKEILKKTAHLKVLDVSGGKPIINMATSILDGLFSGYGKNSNDTVWSNIPLLDINPGPGVAFLRSGIYIVFEMNSCDKKRTKCEDLVFKNGEVLFKSIDKDDKKTKYSLPSSNTLVFSIRLKPEKETKRETKKELVKNL